MTKDQEPLDRSEEGKEKKRGLQRNERGSEDPASVITSEETKKEEEKYYEEGNGGATD